MAGSDDTPRGRAEHRAALPIAGVGGALASDLRAVGIVGKQPFVALRDLRLGGDIAIGAEIVGQARIVEARTTRLPRAIRPAS